jgi:uncharacterized protein (TIGR03032 family)
MSENSFSEEELRQLADEYKELDFSCHYSGNLPRILKELNISLAFTSYQAGRLMLVRSDGDSLDVNYNAFPRPMGLTATEDGLTLGIFTQVLHFQREDGLLNQLKAPLERIENDITAPRIKPKEEEKEAAEKEISSDEALPREKQQDDQQKEENDREFEALEQTQHRPADERTDACFIARSSHYSGMINVHDIDWGDEGLWAVNSSFSCLCTLESDYSFVPRWKPYFISELAPEDRCHLNGMTLRDGKPAYVTTFSMDDKTASWRKKEDFNGTLMDVQENKVLIDGLKMPHSPRWYQDRVYFCNSGLGQLCSYHPETGKHEVVVELPGFTRGMDFFGSLLFLGLSKVRKGNVRQDAPLTEKFDETFSGIWVINLNDNSVVGCIKFTGNVDQIYDVTVLPGCSFPELLGPTHPRLRNHFCHPQLQSMN